MQIFHGKAALQAAHADLKKLISAEHEHDKLGAEHTDSFRLYWWLCEPTMADDINFVEDLLHARHGIGESNAKKARTGPSAAPKAIAEASASSSSSGAAPSKRDLLRAKTMAAF